MRTGELNNWWGTFPRFASSPTHSFCIADQTTKVHSGHNLVLLVFIFFLDSACVLLQVHDPLREQDHVISLVGMFAQRWTLGRPRFGLEILLEFYFNAAYSWVQFIALAKFSGACIEMRAAAQVYSPQDRCPGIIQGYHWSCKSGWFRYKKGSLLAFQELKGMKNFTLCKWTNFRGQSCL